MPSLSWSRCSTSWNKTYLQIIWYLCASEFKRFSSFVTILVWNKDISVWWEQIFQKTPKTVEVYMKGNLFSVGFFFPVKLHCHPDEGILLHCKGMTLSQIIPLFSKNMTATNFCWWSEEKSEKCTDWNSLSKCTICNWNFGLIDVLLRFFYLRRDALCKRDLSKTSVVFDAVFRDNTTHQVSL